MADNKYPNESFSVDDILNEVHAMREKAEQEKVRKESAPKADMITPEEVMEIKVEPVKNKNGDKKTGRRARPNTITPEEINGEAGNSSVVENSEDLVFAAINSKKKRKDVDKPVASKKATKSVQENASMEKAEKNTSVNIDDVDSKEENDKLKSFFSKTKASTYKSDKEYAKRQIDELFKDDPDAVVAPLEKKRKKNANVLSPEEINAKKSTAVQSSHDDSSIGVGKHRAQAVNYTDNSETQEFDLGDVAKSPSKAELKLRKKEEKAAEKERRAAQKAAEKAAKKEERERRKYEPDPEDVDDVQKASSPIKKEKHKQDNVVSNSTDAAKKLSPQKVSSLSEPEYITPVAPKINEDELLDAKKLLAEKNKQRKSQNKPVINEKTDNKTKVNTQENKSVKSDSEPPKQTVKADNPNVSDSKRPPTKPIVKEKDDSTIANEMPEIESPHIRPLHVGGAIIEQLREPEPEKADEIDDYCTIEDAESVRAGLDARLASLSKKTALTFVLTVLLGIFTLLPAFGVSLPSFVSPTDNTTVYLWINVVLFVLAVIINIRTVLGGLVSLFKLSPDVDTAVGIAAVASLVQSILFLFMSEQIAQGNGFLYTAIVAAALMFNLIGKSNTMKRVRSNFDKIATTGTKKSCFVERSKNARVIVDSKSIGKPVVACSRTVVNLHGFLFNSFCEDPSDSFCKIIAPIGAIMSILAGAISYFIGSDVMSAVGAITAATAICVPLTTTLASSRSVSSAAKYVRSFGGMLSGYNAAEDFNDVEYVAVDADELFPAGSVDLLSLKAVGNCSIDDVMMDASALVIAAGGPLANIFERMIDGRQSNVKKVDGIIYHEGLGISGTVGIDTIAVGNRKMVEKVGDVNLPDVEVEKKISRNNCYSVYIMRNEVLCGMLIVRYNSIDTDLEEQLQKLVESGVELLVKTCDPNVTEKMIALTFSLDESAISIMSTRAASICEDMTSPRENGDSVISHSNSLAGFACAITAAKKLYSNVKSSIIVQTVGMIIGLIAVLFVIIKSSYASVLPTTMFIYQLICTVAVLIVSSFRKP